MTQLTKEEIEMIEREAGKRYPIEGTLTKLGEANQFIKRQAFYNGVRFMTAKLLAERERAGKLMELLNEINRSLYTGEDLKDGEILDWYMRVIDTIKDEIKTAINEYNNKP